MPAEVTPLTIQRMSQTTEALKLRAKGHTYEEIADRLGYANPARARLAVTKALEHSFREPAKHVRELEARRLDELQAAAWPAAVAGSDKAINAVLRIMERRAKLFGLDAPSKIEHRVELDSAQAAALVDVLNRVFNDLGLSPEQRVIAGEVVPARLREIASGVDA